MNQSPNCRRDSDRIAVQVHHCGARSDNFAKIPFTVVPVYTGTREKIAKISFRLMPHPHPAAGQSVMREMQRGERNWFIAGI